MKLVFLAALVVACLGSSLVERKENAQRKQWFERSSEDTALVPLQPSTFKTYVTGGPRPYTTFLLMTDVGASSVATAAASKAALESVRQAAAAYQSIRVEKNHEVVFGWIDRSEAEEIFLAMPDVSTPSLLMVPPSKKHGRPRVGKMMQRIDSRSILSEAAALADAGAITSWVRKKTGVAADAEEEVSTAEMFTFVFQVGVLLALAVAFRKYLVRLGSIWYLWIVVFLVFYAFCVGGGMFNRVRNTQPYHRTHTGITYIHPQARQQFSYEGYLMGAANLAAGVGMIGLVVSQMPLPDKFESVSKLSLLALMLSVWAFYQILDVYTFKNASYRHGRVGFWGSRY